MRAAVCLGYGEPEMVEVTDIPSAPVGPKQVRVRVEAAAVNYPDVLIVADKYQVSAPTPFTPGSEFCGVVVESGEGGRPELMGCRVFGTTMIGAFAEEVVVPASSVTAVPDGVEARHAAAFGVAHRTAYHTLRSAAGLAAGDELIVLGAGGGVGLAAVQLGVVMGASVTAVASTAEKLEVAAAYGATRLVNHTGGSLRDALKGVLPGGADVVVDPVGGPLSEPALRALRSGGRFVTVGFASGEIPRIPLNLVLLKGIVVLGYEARNFMTHHTADAVRNEGELMALLAGGRATPYIGATFPLEEAAAALRYVADGRAVGKVVIKVS